MWRNEGTPDTQHAFGRVLLQLQPSAIVNARQDNQDNKRQRVDNGLDGTQ